MSKRLALPAVALLALSFAVGCASQQKAKTTVEPVATDAAYQRLKADYAAAMPDAKLGYVSEVAGADKMLSVTMVDAKDFAPGTPISIVDGDNHTVGFGTVARTAAGGDGVYVKYDQKGLRGPKAGDVAVKFPAPPNMPGVTAPAATQPGMTGTGGGTGM